jgi:selenocysteine lyase/cysteine desulfurase
MPDPPAVVKKLASQRIIIDSRPGAIRISPNFYNTVEDNARIIDAVQAAAAGAGG